MRSKLGLASPPMRPQPREASLGLGPAALPVPVAASDMAASGGEGPVSLLELTAPIRSCILLHVVGDLLRYSGANEANVELNRIQASCHELYQQVNEECRTFSYDDACGLGGGVGRSDENEMKRLNSWVARLPRLKYFECVLRSASRLRALLDELQLPKGTKCSFVLEFKVSLDDLCRLLERFRIWRLNAIPEDPPDGSERLASLAQNTLRTLCLRNCSDAMVRALLASSPQLRGLQILDSRLLSDPQVSSACLTSLCLSGIVTMPDSQFTAIIATCRNLSSLYISKCNVSHVRVSLPKLELLSVTHCRQLTDQCASELLSPACNPRLRFVDLTEDRGLVSPVIAHPGLEVAWLMHCQQLTDQAVSQLFENCPSLTAANLVQSSIENAVICSPMLRTVELTTSQKLGDEAVTQLLRHCPNLSFLDVGHCCQLHEPRLEHERLETILLSFCVNLREGAVVTLLASCPALRYVELAVCMFDMTRFQREAKPGCLVVVNFDF
eukprot:TRINITY_DN46669_c0_g1_i1.p1 TRINITY_DN46669_c0_g1~~TRINITY_DN46669_c0_g1_i1.p1  ORF type:complete len:499 (-),score=100.27 TRINITY_DN46669_c0_g1_i1:121-1617(-)